MQCLFRKFRLPQSLRPLESSVTELIKVNLKPFTLSSISVLKPCLARRSRSRSRSCIAHNRPVRTTEFCAWEIAIVVGLVTRRRRFAIVEPPDVSLVGVKFIPNNLGCNPGMSKCSIAVEDNDITHLRICVLCKSRAEGRQYTYGNHFVFQHFFCSFVPKATSKDPRNIYCTPSLSVPIRVSDLQYFV